MDLSSAEESAFNALAADAVTLHQEAEALLMSISKETGIVAPPEFLQIETSFEWPKLAALPISWANVLESERIIQSYDRKADSIARRNDFIASTYVEGFWDAVLATLGVYRMEKNNNSHPMIPVVLLLLSKELKTENNTRLANILAYQISKENPEFSAVMGKFQAGRKSDGLTAIRKLLSPSDCPRGILLRGWTSHFFWMMNQAARLQLVGKMKKVKTLTKSIDEKFIKEANLFVHPDPPILGLREGDEFQFRPGWPGPKPRPSHLIFVKP